MGISFVAIFFNSDINSIINLEKCGQSVGPATEECVVCWLCILRIRGDINMWNI
jgi:hypothetical protein